MQGNSHNLVEFSVEDQLQKERIKRALNQYWDVGDINSLHEMGHMLLEMFYMQKGMTGFMVKEAAFPVRDATRKCIKAHGLRVTTASCVDSSRVGTILCVTQPADDTGTPRSVLGCRRQARLQVHKCRMERLHHRICEGLFTSRARGQNVCVLQMLMEKM